MKFTAKQSLCDPGQRWKGNNATLTHLCPHIHWMPRLRFLVLFYCSAFPRMCVSTNVNRCRSSFLFIFSFRLGSINECLVCVIRVREKIWEMIQVPYFFCVCARPHHIRDNHKGTYWACQHKRRGTWSCRIIILWIQRLGAASSCLLIFLGDRRPYLGFQRIIAAAMREHTMWTSKFLCSLFLCDMVHIV